MRFLEVDDEAKQTMRAKTPKFVVTFTTTSDAMAMESASRAFGIPGRTIPVPSEIDAGCGLAWCVDASERNELVESLEKHELVYEGVFELMMY